VGLDWGVTTEMLMDWPHFMGRWSDSSKQGPSSLSSSFQETGEPIQEPKWEGHGWTGIGKKSVFKLFTRNHCTNVGGHLQEHD
jgi:hypothetical protein